LIPRSPIWKSYESVDSTQTTASELITAGADVGVIVARHQTNGKGRFGRKWHSSPGEVLAMSIVFDEHPRPYLLGMACALGVAEALGAQIQWPNDVVIGGKKVAGILTEIKPDRRSRRLPVVGIGVNLNQTHLPDEIAHRAVSLRMRDGQMHDAEVTARLILDQIANIPLPSRWTDLEDRWLRCDATLGKHYQLNSGSIGVATGVGAEGELECLVEGIPQKVYAADALFGPGQ
jgi:BirA family biotin operon repressor/biotin-[acetyl-CoA-carboxylase] ligase